MSVETYLIIDEQSELSVMRIIKCYPRPIITNTTVSFDHIYRYSVRIVFVFF